MYKSDPWDEMVRVVNCCWTREQASLCSTLARQHWRRSSGWKLSLWGSDPKIYVEEPLFTSLLRLTKYLIAWSPQPESLTCICQWLYLLCYLFFTAPTCECPSFPLMKDLKRIQTALPSLPFHLFQKPQMRAFWVLYSRTYEPKEALVILIVTLKS